MATVLFVNNAATLLATAISDTATSLTVASGGGDQFPSPTGGDYFVLILSAGLVNEILHVTARVGDIFTVVRAQEGTQARAWAAGTVASNFWTAGQADVLMSAADAATAAADAATAAAETATDLAQTAATAAAEAVATADQSALVAGTALSHADQALVVGQAANTTANEANATAIAAAATAQAAETEAAAAVATANAAEAAVAGKQPLSGNLTEFSDLTFGINEVPYVDPMGGLSLTAFTAAARALVGQTTQALMRTVGLGMSSDGSSLVSANDYAAMRVLLAISLVSNERISVNTVDTGSRLQVYTSAGDGTSASGIYVEHYNAAAGAYGIESRVFPTCYGNVTHHYSDQGPAWQMDNVGNQSILVLANAENGAVRPGVKGTGAFISFVGYGVATPTVRSTLGYISPSLQFASNEPGNQWTFVNGVSLLAGLTETNRALTVTSLNTGYNSTFYGKINGPYMATDTDGGVALTIAKTSVGGGVGQSIINLGTGESLTMSNSGGRTAGFAANGYLGIGTVGGTHGVAVLLATPNTALFASSGANDAQVRIDTANTGQKAVTILGSAFSTKWTYGKDTDDSFFIQIVGGSKVFEISAANVATLKSTDGSTFSSATSTGVLTLGASGKAVTLGNAGSVNFDVSSTVGWTGRTLLSSSADGVFGISNNAVSAYAYLAAETTNALSIRNSTNAQTLRVYNTYTDASNYERGEVTFASNILKIQTAAAGTGTASAIQFGVGGTQWGINTSGHWVALADGAFNIGASGANRPNNVYVAGLITIGSATAMLTSSVAMNNGAAAAAGTLLNAPVAGNPTKWIPFNDNGTTRYIPAW